MSTLQADTLNNRAGTKTVPVDTVIDGSAKAWVNFNGTGTVTIRASFNVSSITDNGTGDYTINFTDSMADANYAVVGSSGATGVTSASSAIAMCVSSLLAGSARVVTVTGGGAAADRDQMHAAFFR